jgi:hypothetical protein
MRPDIDGFLVFLAIIIPNAPYDDKQVYKVSRKSVLKCRRSCMYKYL